MPNRNLLPAALAAGLIAGSSDADIVAVAEAERQASPSEDVKPKLNIAEMMYAGDGNVGVSQPSRPIAIRAPKPLESSDPRKSGGDRGTGKALPQNKEGPRRQSRTSKKGD